MSSVKRAKRKVVWKIQVTRDIVEVCNTKFHSEDFKISFDDNNSTFWRLLFVPRRFRLNLYGELFIFKLKVDENNFIFKACVSIRQNLYKNLLIDKFERKSDDFVNFALESDFGWIRLGRINDLKKFIIDNCLKIFIELELSKTQKSSPASCTFSTLNEKFFKSKAFADFTFVSSDDKKIAVHRCIVAAQSEVFEAMFNTEMMESKMNRVKFEDLDGETMTEMIRFIYTGRAENLDTFASSLLYVAEKYNLPELKSICAESLIKDISQTNIFDTFNLADRCREDILLEKCFEFIKIHYNELRVTDEWKKFDKNALQEIMDSIVNSYSDDIIPLCSVI